MTEETMPASAPAEATTQQPAEQTPAQETYYEQPAETPEHEDYEDPAELGDILEDRPKKLSGAQRAKRQREQFMAERESLQNENSQMRQRLEELERYIHDEDDRRRSSESERQADAQRKLDEDHRERLKSAKDTITDFDRVMASMRGATIHEDLLGDVLASDKSHLLAYHLAKNPDKLAELNQMSERARAREIGRLEGSLKMPEGRKQTKAPPPPSSLKGGAAPHRALEQVDDMKEFSRRLLKDLAERAGR